MRGAGLLEDEALLGEWDVAVVGPHFAGAFVARDLGDEGEDGDRRFDFFVTYERELVVRAARALMARIVPRGAVARPCNIPDLTTADRGEYVLRRPRLQKRFW